MTNQCQKCNLPQHLCVCDNQACPRCKTSDCIVLQTYTPAVSAGNIRVVTYRCSSCDMAWNVSIDIDDNLEALRAQVSRSDLMLLKLMKSTDFRKSIKQVADSVNMLSFFEAKGAIGIDDIRTEATEHAAKLGVKLSHLIRITGALEEK